MSRRSAVALLLVLQAAYLVFMLIFGRFIAGDEIAYKAAGREWARSGTFAAPELRGYAAWIDPKHPEQLGRGFAPPLYTFGFGLFVKVVGFNPATNAAWDALIHLALGWATLLLARALAPRLAWGYAAAAAAATLPLGTAGRPDELGAVLAMLGSIVLLRGVTGRRTLLAGLLFGLAAGASLVALVLGTWPLYAFLRARRLGLLIAFGIVTVAVFGLVMTPLVIIMPDGIAQLSGHAGDSVRTTYAYALANGWRYGRHHYLAILAALPVAAAGLLQALRSRTPGSWAALWTPPLFALAVLIALVPAKHYYFWMVVPSLFAAAAVTLAALDWSRIARLALVALVALIWLGAASRFGLTSVIRATLPADQRLPHNLDVIHRLVPRGAGVLTYDFWPALMDGTYETYATDAAFPPWERIDYVILTGNGSGAPGRPQTLLPEQQRYVDGHYTVIHDNLNRTPFRIGPLKTNSAWGYGPLILKRK